MHTCPSSSLRGISVALVVRMRSGLVAIDSYHLVLISPVNGQGLQVLTCLA